MEIEWSNSDCTSEDDANGEHGKAGIEVRVRIAWWS
jgi:hypothetical protein